MDTHSSKYITGDAAFAVDRRGAIVLWNAAAEKMLGHPASEALGEKCWSLLSGKDTYGNQHCCKHCPIREMAFRDEPVNCFQSSYKTATDQYMPFSVSCLAIFEKPGNEMLMHICHPENQSLKDGRGQAPASSQPGALSQRETTVLALLADNISTRSIAAELSISIRTVRTHIQHLMYKLQVHKRCEAIEVGKRLKLI